MGQKKKSNVLQFGMEGVLYIYKYDIFLHIYSGYMPKLLASADLSAMGSVTLIWISSIWCLCSCLTSNHDCLSSAACGDSHHPLLYSVLVYLFSLYFLGPIHHIFTFQSQMALSLVGAEYIARVHTHTYIDGLRGFTVDEQDPESHV